MPGEPLCPSCGFRNDGTVAADGTRALPRDGDASICLNCGEPARFHETAFGMGLRLLDAEERAEFEHEFATLFAKVREVRDDMHRHRETDL